MQPMPACACGVFTICLMGVSIMPLYSNAGSWQPAHHFDGFTPSTSCMYSMLLRYHCLKMSWWQRSQASDSMKNFDGMLRLPYTCEELGKNLPFAPSPSLFIES